MSNQDKKNIRNRNDAKDQWASARINRYDKDTSEDVLTNLHSIYEKRTRIIQHDCLDEFDTVYKPHVGKRKPAPQQPHESLDKIYTLERVSPEVKSSKQHRYKLNIFRQCWSGVEQDQDTEKYNYVMKNINSTVTHIPDGLYLYIIYSEMPQVVVCGAYNSARPMVGHTSLIKSRLFWCRRDINQPMPNDDEIDYTRYPVLLAGELTFVRGVLMGWNNRSGHYRPKIAPVEEFGATDYILPRQLFKPTGMG